MRHSAAAQSAWLNIRLRRQRGFALLEILVAFVILALGLGTLSSAIAVAMRSDGHSQARRVAFRIAESRLEAAGVAETLVPGYRQGRIAGNYRWREMVTAAQIGATSLPSRDEKPSQPADSAGITSYWVEVTVQAADGTMVQLAALKLGSRTKQ